MCTVDDNLPTPIVPVFHFRTNMFPCDNLIKLEYCPVLT